MKTTFCTLPLDIRFDIFDLVFIASVAEDPEVPSGESRDDDFYGATSHYPHSKSLVHAVNRQLHDDFNTFVDKHPLETQVFVQTLKVCSDNREDAEMVVRKRLSYPGIRSINHTFKADYVARAITFTEAIVSMLFFVRQNSRFKQIRVDIDERTPLTQDHPPSTISVGSYTALLDTAHLSIEYDGGSLKHWLSGPLDRALKALQSPPQIDDISCVDEYTQVRHFRRWFQYVMGHTSGDGQKGATEGHRGLCSRLDIVQDGTLDSLRWRRDYKFHYRKSAMSGDEIS